MPTLEQLDVLEGSTVSTLDGYGSACHGRSVANVREAGVGSPNALRQANRRRVLEALRHEGVSTQSALARRTGLSRATVFNIVQELEQGGVVVRSGAGRTVEIAFSRNAGLAIGIDVDHRHLRVAVADLNHAVLHEDLEPLSDGAAADSTIARAAELVDGALGTLDAGLSDVVGIGMCLPAPMDVDSGTVGSTSILPGWIGIPAAEAVQYRLGLPVIVDNDANLGALAELTWGAARGFRDVVYLKMATGIGAGIVIRGELYRGASGTAGEIGHTTIDERGPICRCGSRGCLEALVGGEALLALLPPTHAAVASLPDLVAQAAAGDPACQRVVADAGRHIGIAVANIFNTIAPECVVLGGELADAGDLVFDPIRASLAAHAVRPAVERVVVTPAALGDRAEVLGAIAVVLHAHTPSVSS
jgi:predicted NBD/HSP70 family sugar kinase/biotin operon repressor